MKFSPEKYELEDVSQQPFISETEINKYLGSGSAGPEPSKVREIIAKSLEKNRLNLQEVATLLKTTDEPLLNEIKEGARKLKEDVYGNRIVLFAPLYVGNYCTNNCRYCGFRASNKNAQRKTLTRSELICDVEALEDQGQKRLILVFGEHPDYSPEYIAETVRTVYSVKKGKGEIRRLNINAAPLDIEGFRTVKEAGIGTYQVFQETYHPETYRKYHTGGKKADYNFRLAALDRAMEAGIDDVGIGALFGLYDWRFEVMALVRHTSHLEACFNTGPHTISFPRLQEASDSHINNGYRVGDEEFTMLISILRLAVPYTGMILTAREPEHVRKEVIRFGCSQIDAGSKIEIGAYSRPAGIFQDLNKEQFFLNDNRTLDEVISELIDHGQLPSFCTACYRLGRTGEHFMEFSVPGFIKRFCTPNALLTMAEYLCDYATPGTAEKGWRVIHETLDNNDLKDRKAELTDRINRIKNGERDLYF
ncbi:MAG: [FeFe] hydrogenase H-cluster radical SAM maturase HydG [Bacteroidales bacterium]|nr:[FeFe] hydrogenase H-cluster radical SAM maturase HydG [Bacteroidales bacterium]